MAAVMPNINNAERTKKGNPLLMKQIGDVTSHELFSKNPAALSALRYDQVQPGTGRLGFFDESGEFNVTFESMRDFQEAASDALAELQAGTHWSQQTAPNPFANLVSLEQQGKAPVSPEQDWYSYEPYKEEPTIAPVDNPLQRLTDLARGIPGAMEKIQEFIAPVPQLGELPSADPYYYGGGIEDFSDEDVLMGQGQMGTGLVGGLLGVPITATGKNAPFTEAYLKEYGEELKKQKELEDPTASEEEIQRDLFVQQFGGKDIGPKPVTGTVTSKEAGPTEEEKKVVLDDLNQRYQTGLQILNDIDVFGPYSGAGKEAVRKLQGLLRFQEAIPRDELTGIEGMPARLDPVSSVLQDMLNEIYASHQARRTREEENEQALMEQYFKNPFQFRMMMEALRNTGQTGGTGASGSLFGLLQSMMNMGMPQMAPPQFQPFSVIGSMSPEERGLYEAGLAQYGFGDPARGGAGAARQVAGYGTPGQQRRSDAEILGLPSYRRDR
jgi:hypothetical protein